MDMVGGCEGKFNKLKGAMSERESSVDSDREDGLCKSRLVHPHV